MTTLNEQAVLLLRGTLVGQLVSVKLMWLGAPLQWMFITHVSYDDYGLYYKLHDGEVYREPFIILGIEERERRKRDFDSSKLFSIYDKASIIKDWTHTTRQNHPGIL